ncbi:23S rRNA pseudouridine(1911/1915/1917) synthase RluD [Pleionea sp. CnH1-48]|uniref:23S rRNA pseudouridine(1911/1915/1917) synthase RluD n=1 Tax=Pleionea sp. CnH1-48 TaxID=2954494 RepID=UPI00209865F6|nr:23S rRNA pseudouridine(1911/1915/1917) synthase RluD [Pleionea sp. CnH1-48]MCO7225304.1 23S rRNA pseudouridine(1911/1915/1917) synthase RluD [Pleionea sp. CnH1-48]
MSTKTSYQQTFEVTEKDYGHRLDQVLAAYCEGISRSRLQDWVKNGQVLVNEQPVTKTRYKIQGNETITVDAEIEQAGTWEPEDIPLDIVYEDEAILVINKPAGLVVHPAAGNYSGTMVNALLNHDESLIQLPRAGIVHRLDKDTTGLLVVARTLEAHTHLVAQLQERAFEREYQCIVHGQFVSGGTIDAPIGRHPTSRLKMAVVNNGKEAITHYRLKDKFTHFTHLQVNLETGRTHQIRVHMAHARYPLVGDLAYGKKNYAPSGSSDALRTALREFRRQALHARKLGLMHPEKDEFMSWEADVPSDYAHLLDVIRAED